MTTGQDVFFFFFLFFKNIFPARLIVCSAAGSPLTRLHLSTSQEKFLLCFPYNASAVAGAIEAADKRCHGAELKRRR